MLDVQSGQSSQVAAHDEAVKCVKWIDAQGGILATGSWDKTIKVGNAFSVRITDSYLWMYMQYWDLRTQNPVATVTLPERCYTMDVAFPLLVVGTAERHIQVYNLNNPTVLYRVRVILFYKPTPSYDVCYSGHSVSIEDADSRGIMFPCRKWICYW